MKITETLDSVHLAVVQDTYHGGHLGKDISDIAIAAVNGGFGSPAWGRYMTLFVDNKAQLERLTVKAAGENTYYAKGRAYIVANATCGADTDTFTRKGLEDQIEENIPGAADGLIVDPGDPIPPNGVVRELKIVRVPK